jgi:hypothetical protein
MVLIKIHLNIFRMIKMIFLYKKLRKGMIKLNKKII